jgi:hypothetical protein
MRSIDAIWEKDDILHLGKNHQCLIQVKGEPFHVVYDNIQNVYDYFQTGFLILSCYKQITSNAQYPTAFPHAQYLAASRAVQIKKGKELFRLITDDEILRSIKFTIPRKKLIEITMSADLKYYVAFQDEPEHNMGLILGKEHDKEQIWAGIPIKNFSYYDEIFKAHKALLEDNFYAFHRQ